MTGAKLTSAKLTSALALAMTIVPSLILLLFGGIGLETVKWVALAGTVAWFVSAPIWMDREAS